MVHGLPHFIVSNVSYVVSIYGKHHCEPFPSQATYHAKSIWEFVHMNLCGPMRHTTLGGAWYFMLIIDDLSHNVWVYLLSIKPEAFSRFQEWVPPSWNGNFQQDSKNQIWQWSCVYFRCLPQPLFAKRYCLSVFCVQISTKKCSRKEEWDNFQEKASTILLLRWLLKWSLKRNIQAHNKTIKCNDVVSFRSSPQISGWSCPDSYLYHQSLSY